MHVSFCTWLCLEMTLLHVPYVVGGLNKFNEDCVAFRTNEHDPCPRIELLHLQQCSSGVPVSSPGESECAH